MRNKCEHLEKHCIALKKEILNQKDLELKIKLVINENERLNLILKETYVKMKNFYINNPTFTNEFLELVMKNKKINENLGKINKMDYEKLNTKCKFEFYNPKNPNQEINKKVAFIINNNKEIKKDVKITKIPQKKYFNRKNFFNLKYF